MRISLYLSAAALVLLPSLATADEGPKSPRPNPEAVFKHLDANSDGVLTRDELPPRMAERFDEVVSKVDKNDDKKLDQEEFASVVRHLRERFGDRRRPGPDRERFADRGGPGADRPYGGPGPGRSERHPSWEGRRPDGPPGKHAHGMHLARGLFERMDRDNDDQLSFREFAVGMAILRSRHEGHRPWGRPDMGRRDMGRWDMGRPDRPHPGKALFERMDKDGDGKISKSEAPERLQSHFDKVDRDSDGCVSKEEMKQAMMALAKRFHEKRADDNKCDAQKSDKKKSDEKKGDEKK